MQTYATFVAAPPTLSLTTGEKAPITVNGTDQWGNPFITAVTWSLVSGPTGGTATFDSPLSRTTQVSFNLPGTYAIQARASDSFTPARTSTITATVTSSTVLRRRLRPRRRLRTSRWRPWSSAPGPNQTITLPVSSVTLNGTVTDNNGQPLELPLHQRLDGG